MRRTLISVLAVLALLVAACAEEPEAEPDVAAPDEEAEAPDDDEDDEDDLEEEEEVDVDEDADEDALDIAFVSPELDITQFFGQFYAELTDVLDGAGVDYNVTEAAPAGGQEDLEGLDRILGDIQTLDPDYFVLVISDFESVEPRLLELQEQGVEMILVDYMPEETDVDPITWVLTDHVESGYITGYAAAEHYRDEGLEHVDVAMFHGTAGSEIGIDRMDGYLEGFEDGAAEFGFSFDVIEEVWTEFNREMAFNVSQDVGQAHPDLDVVFGANSNTSLGVMEGLRNIGRLGEVQVTGIGGQLEELAAICTGDILTAGVRNPRDQGALAAELLIQHIEGEGDAIDEVNYGDQAVVNNCDDAFEVFPVEMLDQAEFRDNIPDDMWQGD